jgi:hypothetical protein
MITEEILRKTNISFTYIISPVKNVICDLSAMIGNFCEDAVGSFYPTKVGKKANVVVTELLNNALENINDGNSKIGLKLTIDENRLIIRVINVVTVQQFESVRHQVEKINSSADIKKVLKERIHERRKDRLKGGLGLIRLVAENKFKLSVGYKKPYLIMESQFSLGDLN